MNTPVSIEIDKILIEKSIDMPVKTTISDVVMWLYKKHNIWIAVELHPRKLFYHNIYKNDKAIEDLSEDFDTPTKTYEAAIEYTLKNLI